MINDRTLEIFRLEQYTVTNGPLYHLPMVIQNERGVQIDEDDIVIFFIIRQDVDPSLQPQLFYDDKPMLLSKKFDNRGNHYIFEPLRFKNG